MIWMERKQWICFSREELSNMKKLENISHLLFLFLPFTLFCFFGVGKICITTLFYGQLNKKINFSYWLKRGYIYFPIANHFQWIVAQKFSRKRIVSLSPKNLFFLLLFWGDSFVHHFSKLGLHFRSFCLFFQLGMSQFSANSLVSLGFQSFSWYC